MKAGQSMLVAAAVMAATSAAAAELSLKVTIPQLGQATAGPRQPRHPYVAIWLRREDNSFATNLAVWYQVEAPARRGGPGGPGGFGGAGPGGFGGPPGAGPGPGRGGPVPGAGPAGGRGGPGGPGGPGPGGMGPGGARGPMPGLQPNPRTPGGARWLYEVREWWADSGNELQFPVDGLTSASRAAGTYELTFAGDDPKLAGLPPGNYKLMVEAAREHGGKESLSIPFEWPGTAAQTGTASGRSELGQVELTVTP